MSARQQNSLLQSLRSLIDPKTIPFLISQGVPRKLLPVGTLMLGMVLGFLWAYVISPNVYTGAGPVHLSNDYKEVYVKQVAWQYSISHDDAEARRSLDSLGNAPEIVANLRTELANDPDMTAKLDAIQPFAQENPTELNRIQSSLLNSNLTPLLCVVAVAIIFGGVVIFNTIIPIGVLFQRREKGPASITEGVEAQRRVAETRAKEMAAAAAKAPPSPAMVDRGTPVGRYMSTYIMGDDLYDDSFSIETNAGEFLGETGAGISKTIGVGDPKKVTAVEVWVFDKNDIRTVTKVIMSEYAYNDEAIRQELAPKGEAVVLKTGDITLLETQTLTVQAKAIDLGYGTGALPPNSFFERISIEISAWPKKAAATPPMPPAFGETSQM